MIASVIQNPEGKYSIKVNERILQSKPMPADITLSDKRVLEDLAAVINSQEPPLSPDFKLEDLPVEYNLVCMLDNFYQGMNWMNDEGTLWWFISLDTVFRVSESEYLNHQAFTPIRNYLNMINENWEALPPIPSSPSVEEYSVLEKDEANYVSLAIGEKMTMAYAGLSAIEKVAISNLWLNTNESTMLCFSLTFGCCSIEEFAESIVYRIPLKANEERARTVNRIIAHAESVMNWMERNKS